ncbi:MAG: sugar phosphate isomerase/epimerase [Clostridia bacterium]|nr:sugar phosphate isomerase/epimerase [Clostridia bacterium]
MKRIVAVNSNCYHGFSLDEAIEGIRDAGFHYIELTATKGWTEHVFPSMSFEKLDGIRDRLRDAGLIPFAMSGHCNLMDTERIRDFIENIRLAAFFGCDYIVSSIGEAHLKDRASADDASLVKTLRGLLPELEDAGLTLVLETHGKEHGTGERIASIVQQVASKRIRINYDTANVVFYGDVDPCEDLKKCVKDVGYLHLKDKAGRNDVWDFPALGKGRIDFPEIFRILEESGNDSPFSIEIEFTQSGPKNVAEVHQAVKDSAAYLAAHGFEL